jgi:cell division protein FtsB
MRKGSIITGTQEEIAAARSSRKRWLIFLAGLATLIAVASVVEKKSFVKVLQMSKTRTELQQEIARLRQVNEGLAREIRAFANNPSQVEAIAREDLGLVKPGEIVYQFGPPRPSTALPASSR